MYEYDNSWVALRRAAIERDPAVVVLIHAGVEDPRDLVAVELGHVGAEARVELGAGGSDQRHDAAPERRELGREPGAEGDAALHIGGGGLARPVGFCVMPRETRHGGPTRRR